MPQVFHLVVADGKYGNHSFLSPLKEEPCGVLARMRCDRVLYKDPGEYICPHPDPSHHSVAGYDARLAADGTPIMSCQPTRGPAHTSALPFPPLAQME
jgi:hypothetical protein